MSYNYYNGYNPYSNPYQSYYPQNNMMYGNQQQYQPQQQAQQNFIPMYYVQGIEGAKAYNMNPNSTVLLKDSESNLLFMKTSDNQCKCVLEPYQMIKVEEAQPIQKQQFDVTTLVTKTDLEDFKKQIVSLIGGVKDEK